MFIQLAEVPHLEEGKMQATLTIRQEAVPIVKSSLEGAAQIAGIWPASVSSTAGWL